MSENNAAPLLVRGDADKFLAHQAVYSGSSSNIRPVKDADLFIIDKGGAVHGDAATVGEAHLSYLCRAWEVNACDVWHEDSHVDVRPVPTTYEPPIRGDAYIMAGVNLMLCIGSFYLLTEVLHVEPISAAPLCLFISHLGCWLLVSYTSGWVLYRSYSVADGLNVITRFTLKLSIPDAPDGTTFIQSNMASSISSTVSTRGSTLNKLMIGTGFSLGLGLFIKFMTLHTRTWTTDMTAFGYAFIILTSYYENRTFDLEDSQMHNGHKLDIKDQTLDDVQLRDEKVGRLRYLSQKPKPSYSRFHMIGVSCFIGVPFIGYCLTFAEHQLSFFLSLGGLICGVMFFTMDGTLNSGDQEHWLNRRASKHVNIARGIACISIELCCLTLASLAGICYKEKTA